MTDLHIPVSSWNEKGLHQLAFKIRKRVRKNKDAVVAITGYEGEGKSTVGLLLAPDVSEKFIIERNMIFETDYNQIEDKINELGRYDVAFFDEATKQLNKANWMTNQVKNLNAYITLHRKDNKVYFLCIPTINDLVVNFRNRRVWLWIHVLQRGIAVAFRANTKSPFKAWYLDDMEKIFTKKEFGYDPDNISDLINRLSKINGFVYAFPFGEVDPELYKKYEEYAMQCAYAGLRNEDKPETESEIMFKTRTGLATLAMLVHDKMLKVTTYTGMAKLIGYSHVGLQDLVKKYAKHRVGVNVHETFTDSEEVSVKATDNIINSENNEKTTT